MDDTQRDGRVIDDATDPQTETSRSTETSGRTVTRMLANPRRVRRD
jgi:hypothetical protein